MEVLALRFVHVLSGVLWVGTAVFVSAFLLPSLMEAGPAAGPVMAGLQKRKMVLYMPILAILAILSGARLLWIDSGGSAAFFGSRAGMAFSVGGALAVLAFILGMTVTRPAMGRAGEIAQRMPSAPEAERPGLVAEMERLRARGAAAGQWVAVMVLGTTVAMAVARYL
jgi:hypothetical protein